MAKEHDGETNNVDSILQNLSRRPNVRSTLILSRRDGSIIKASGSIAKSADENPRGNQVYTDVEVNAGGGSNGANEQVSQDENSNTKGAQSVMSPAHILAESIYSFVTSATALAATVEKIELLGATLTGGIDTDRGGLEKSDSQITGTVNQADNDVQLLRLRLKKQEVIIFPDPNYLCCVVQDFEKSTR